MTRPLKLFWIFLGLCGYLSIVSRCRSDEPPHRIFMCEYDFHGVESCPKAMTDLDRAETACGWHRIGFAKVRTSGEYHFIDEPAEYEPGWQACTKIDQMLIDRHNAEQAKQDTEDLALIERLTK